MNIDEMTAEELRLEIAKAQGWGMYLNASIQILQLTNDPGRKRYFEDQMNGCLPVGASEIIAFFPNNLNEWFDYWKLPNWPADISAAWKLVEEMHEKGYGVNIYARDGVYSCEITSPDHMCKQLFYEFADTAPLAICRAYLKWKQAQP